MARRASRLPPPQTAADIPLAMWDAEAARRKGGGNPSAAILSTPDRMRFADFIRGAWPVLEGPQRPFLPNWHIDAKADLLTAVADGEITRAIVCEPPSYAKSIVTSVCFPAWDWGPNHRPDRRFLCTSYGGDVLSPAMRDAERSRNLMVSPWYQSGWGTEFSLSDAQNARSVFHNDRNGYRLSAGLDGAVPGQRADIVIIDDPTKPPNMELGELPNLNEVKHAADVWESTLRSRAWDDGAAVVLVMHRLHEEDLAGYFLKQDGWTILRLPALYEAEHRCRIFLHGRLFFEDPRTVDGAPLHEARTVATEETRARAVSQPWIHAAQDQQRPAPLVGGLIQHAWMRRWDRLPDAWDAQVIIVDCAFKDQKHNSYVVMQHWARRHGVAYLLDQLRDHLDFPKTMAALLGFCAAHPTVSAKYVEDKANGTGIVQMLKTQVPGLMTTSQDAEGAMGLKQFCAGSKEAKLSAVAPYFASGNVLLPPDAVAGWMPDYVKELTTFRGAGSTRFDDQVDCTAMGVWKLLSSLAIHVRVGETIRQGADVPAPLFGLDREFYGGGVADAYGDTGSGFDTAFGRR